MKYDITKHSAPKMPTLKSVTECVQIQPSQASKDTQNPSFRCFFSHLEHIWAARNFSTPPSFGRPNGKKCGGEWGKVGGWRPEGAKAFLGALVALGAWDGAP